MDNACGTIAIIHALANNFDVLPLKEGSIFGEFMKKALALDPNDRAQLLAETTSFRTAYLSIAQASQSDAQRYDEDLHVIAFVSYDGKLYELDGRKAAPIDHGPCEPFMLLHEAAKVCREFIAENPDCIRFTALALVGE